MKVASLCIAYKEERLIKHHLKHLEGKVDKALVLVSESPYHQFEDGQPDRTGEIALKMGADVVKGSWSVEHDQRNYGLSLLRMYDYVLVLDPDEFILEKDWNILLEGLEERVFKKPAYKAPSYVTYWKKGYVLDPTDTHKPLFLVNPREVTFEHYRGISSEVYDSPIQFPIHHMSWARTDEEMKKKLLTFSHAKEFNGMEWYERVWKTWTPLSTYLHPLTREKWHQAIPYPVPVELQPIIEEI